MKLKLNKCHICEKDFDNLEVHFAAIHDNIATNTDEERPHLEEIHVSKNEQDDELKEIDLEHEEPINVTLVSSDLNLEKYTIPDREKESQINIQQDPELDSEKKSHQPYPEPDPESNPESNPEPDPQQDTKPIPEPDVEPNPEPVPVADPEPDLESDQDSYPHLNVQPYSKPNANLDTEPLNLNDQIANKTLEMNLLIA